MEISGRYIYPVVMETSGLQGQNIQQILPPDLYQTTTKIKAIASGEHERLMQIQAVAAEIF